MPENKENQGLGKRDQSPRRDDEARREREAGLARREEQGREEEAGARNEQKRTQLSDTAEQERRTEGMAGQQEAAQEQGTRVWNQWNDETAAEIQQEAVEAKMDEGTYTGGAVLDASPEVEEFNKAAVRKIHNQE